MLVSISDDASSLYSWWFVMTFRWLMTIWVMTDTHHFTKRSYSEAISFVGPSIAGDLQLQHRWFTMEGPNISLQGELMAIVEQWTECPQLGKSLVLRQSLVYRGFYKRLLEFLLWTMPDPIKNCLRKLLKWLVGWHIFSHLYSHLYFRACIFVSSGISTTIQLLTA